MQLQCVIGLEIHAELKTKSKLFCGCSTAFGAPPNTQCCPVCTGMPGALPALNQTALIYAIMAGLSLHCEISRYTRFDRKNYFYPDLPKAYQISQLYAPLCRNGFLISPLFPKKKIRIREIHLEEDAGKLIHDRSSTESYCDYNRSGVPLIEIVTEPDFVSGLEASEFIKALREIFLCLDICDCKMQEGSLRADINISCRQTGSSQLGTRTEIKNLNSLRSVIQAADAEFHRQTALIKKGKSILQETRRWNENTGKTESLRVKENTAEYRYFPEPDLPPLCLNENWVTAIKERLPELPDARKEHCLSLGLSEENAASLSAAPDLYSFFLSVVDHNVSARKAAGWILTDVLHFLRSSKKELLQTCLTPKIAAELLILMEKGKINREGVRQLTQVLLDKNIDLQNFIQSHGLALNNNTVQINDAIETVIAENPKAATDFYNGNSKTIGFFIGQTMKLLNGSGDPKLIRRILLQKLDENLS
ncbi:Asp-tRNA(Asn)/Glu-tRNA(Gln) amidotransferase subunit GatB [Ructibacterium gallinarum]|uniref:Aspartyl/glutamyl-tRNA(Asn/Gln) amidotransferase subunit B n=1 Tax=Ructibacterium gallinarum TaxID=2779355 RepID=A0A9D5RB30_9FIRM|nr:Asp-tRNA(Asn)/Glu-tRNA(Gln) amidotransferase subunit GatB [Ructibacterium gallinarum]MBE5039643.1 Asp-tRNA(Asn)/Glu-tRNA(Gln) amidotransferase subunit GatB [Ructibacterium gallinarum]